MTIPPSANKAVKAALWMGAPAAVTSMLTALAGVPRAGFVALAIAIAGAFLVAGAVAIYIVRSLNKAVHAPTEAPMARINALVDTIRRPHPEAPAQRSTATSRARDAPRLPHPRRRDHDEGHRPAAGRSRTAHRSGAASR